MASTGTSPRPRSPCSDYKAPRRVAEGPAEPERRIPRLIFSELRVMARVKLNYMKGYGFREPFFLSVTVYTGVNSEHAKHTEGAAGLTNRARYVAR